MLAEEEVVKQFKNNHPHIPPSISPSDNFIEDDDKDLFEIIMDFSNRNSILLIILAIIITVSIISFLYQKSGKKEFFKI